MGLRLDSHDRRLARETPQIPHGAVQPLPQATIFASADVLSVSAKVRFYPSEIGYTGRVNSIRSMRHRKMQ